MKLRRSCSHLFTSCIALLAVLTVASCSKDNQTPGATGTGVTVGPSAAKPASSSSKEIDACTLVTKAEAEAALGDKVKDGDSGPASMQGGSICRYDSPDSMSAKNVVIRVESPNYDWNKVKEDKRIEGEKMRPRRGYLRQVPGLGKDAYFARHALHVLTDKGILTITMFRSPAEAIAGEETETPMETEEKKLAQKAVSRM
ncbi:MAG TPA: DUF3558 family protein [Candidatus Angelobacter sp.]|nr:DUF3558 family protein [Candidatus Angelobacter sp.]